MIKNIHIQGFRGINNLEISDFKKVNLFLGTNNCGKTTILEALFLLTGISNPNLALSIHSFRNLILTENDDFRFLFNKLDFKNIIEIKGSFNNNEKRSLKIKPIFSNVLDKKPLNNQSQVIGLSTTSSSEIANGLDFTIEIGNSKSPTGKKYRSELALEKGIVRSKRPEKYTEKIQGVFIPSKSTISDLSPRIEELIVTKQKEKLLLPLQTIDPNIKDITLGKNLIYLDLGFDRYLPLNVAGDGIQHVLSIITSIAFFENGIVFIDEIENGLHFSALKILWSAIIKVAFENNVQLFITTHNKETLKNLNSVLNKNEYFKYQKDVRTYKIRRHAEDKYVSYPYNYEEFSHSIEQEIEIR